MSDLNNCLLEPISDLSLMTGVSGSINLWTLASKEKRVLRYRIAGAAALQVGMVSLTGASEIRQRTSPAL
jgi:hypothetical protein